MTTAPNSPSTAGGIVAAVFAGPIRALRSPRIPDGASTAWRSAILKSRVDTPVPVGPLGLAGDAQKEKKHHGGPLKAVLLYGAGHYASLWNGALGSHAVEHAAALRAMSPDFDASAYGFGAFGENLTIDGLDERSVFLGDLWQVGECVLRITEPRGPCATLTRRWMRPVLRDEVRSTAAAGWYTAVETSGRVQTGDAVALRERLQTQWSMATVFHLLEDRAVSRELLSALIDAPVTHEALRDRLRRRMATPGRTRD